MRKEKGSQDNRSEKDAPIPPPPSSMEKILERQLPLFPLNAVVFPGQTLELHIFEPRYRQLIHESDQNDLTFGITALFGEEISVYGTEVRVESVHKMHHDGRMDITVKGLSRFKIKNFYRFFPERLYPGGDISQVSENQTSDAELQKKLFATFLLLTDILPMKNGTVDLESTFPSYSMGQHVGLSLKQKVKLLSLGTEPERQKMLLSYLSDLLPVLEKVIRSGKAQESA